MAYELPPLPYAFDALEPHIDAKTMEIHHDRHHAAYVNNANGALQGLNKRETAERFGEDKVKIWRRSYDVRPPALETDDQRHPSHDPRYAGLPPELLPATECLKDVVERMLPYWYDAIVPDLLREDCVLVSAHGNSLRALVKHLDGLTEQQIVDLDIPTGVPRVYDLGSDFKPRSSKYLGDLKEIARRAAAVRDQAGRSR